MNLSGVNLNLLVSFDALCRERHVTRAARRVGITQSAMSNALRQLRALFDDELFVRAPRGVVPTARALALAEPVARALSLLEQAIAPPVFDPRRDARTFVVTADDYVQLVMLPPLLKTLASRAPDLRLKLVHSARHEVPDGLARGEVDLAFGWFGAPPPRHRREKLFTESFTCIVRKGHPRVRKRLGLKTWASLPHVVVSENEEPTSIDRALREHGLSRSIALRVSHVLLVPSLVAETDFSAAVSSRVARRFSQGLALHPLPLDLPPSTASMAWHERWDADPAHGFLREMVAEVARKV